MTRNQFDDDLRAVMRRMANAPVPDELRLRVASVTDSPAEGTPRLSGGWRLASLFAVIAVAALVTLGVTRLSGIGPTATATPGPSLPLGVVPWIDATPVPSPTPEPTPNPSSLPTCSAPGLLLAPTGWEGATGSLAGGASVINISDTPCRVGGKPAVELLDSSGSVIAAGSEATPGSADSVALPSGGTAVAALVWDNWCGPAPHYPLSLRITLPQVGGQLTAALRGYFAGAMGALPRCDTPGAGSSIGVPIGFSTPEPSSGASKPKACAAEQLIAFSGKWGAAAGTLGTGLVIANAGGSIALDCELPASPVLELRDGEGRVLANAQPFPSPNPTVIPADQAATVGVGLADWCRAAPPQPLHFALLVGSMEVKVTDTSPIPVPGCNSIPQTPPPSFFYFGPLTVPGGPVAPEPDTCVETLPISVSVSALPSAKPGATVKFIVTLTNHSGYAKPLNPTSACPNYTERLILAGSGRTVESHFALNWPPDRMLPANGSAAFEMRLQFPTDAPAGTATLIWRLGDRGPAAKTTLVIEP